MMRRADLVLCLRTWAFCALAALFIVGVGYGLAALERQFFPGGARGAAEWLFVVPFLLLVGFGIAILYVALVALLTAVAALLPPGRVRAYVDAQLQQSGTLEKTVAGWSNFGKLALHGLVTVHKWAPGAAAATVKFVAVAILVLVGVAACTYGVFSLHESMSGAPTWAVIIIVLLVLLLLK